MGDWIILGIPGPWPDEADLKARLQALGKPLYLGGHALYDAVAKKAVIGNFKPYSPQLRIAFETAARGRIDPEGLARLDDHKSILFVLNDDQSVEGAWHMVELASRVLDAGGLGVKIESAGCASSPELWRELAQKPTLELLYLAFVSVVFADDHLYTCGMHAFGLPDAVVACSEIEPRYTNLLNDLCLYQLSTGAVVKNGHGFTVGSQGPEYILCLVTESHWAKDDPFYNPYGTWLLEPVPEETKRPGLN